MPAGLKWIAIGVGVLLVMGMAWMLRDELIAKGENIIKAQDNAALVKAQQQQAAQDKLLIASQNDYINTLQTGATKVKEVIRYAQAPPGCPNDGRGDPRLDDAAAWVRGQLTPGPLPPTSGQQPKAAVPAAGAPATARSGSVR